MMYIEEEGLFTVWSGQRLPTGELLPVAIETSWTDEELAAYQIFRPAPADPIPEGKVSNGQTVQRVDGVVRYVHDLADAPPPPSPQVPAEITMRQAKLTLHRAGLLAEVQAQIDALPGDSGDEARIEWASASTLTRDHPLIAIIGLPDQQVDSLFIWASGI